MTTLDDELLPGVAEILNEVGAAAVLTEGPAGGDYNATTGAVTDTPATHNVLITPPSPFNEEAMKGESVEGESDIIRLGDMTTLLSAKLLTDGSVPDPKPGWELTLRSKTWQALVVAPIMSGDSVCAWLVKLGR